MYRMRNPSASTKPSLNASPKCVTIAPSSDKSHSNFPNARQHFLPEQFERAHQEAQITGSRDLEQQIDDAGPDLVATAFDLLHDRVRPADEICRQYAADAR